MTRCTIRRVKAWLAEECSWGIIEAATVLFPEVYDVELPDFLGIKLGAEPRQGDEPRGLGPARSEPGSSTGHWSRTCPTATRRRSRSARIDLLNDAQRYMSARRVLPGAVHAGPAAGQPAERRGPASYSPARMPERDSDFGFATYHEMSRGFSPAARLARWAAAGPYPAYDPEVVELACIPLCWLLVVPQPLHARLGDQSARAAAARPPRCNACALRALLDRR